MKELTKEQIKRFKQIQQEYLKNHPEAHLEENLSQHIRD